MCLQLCRIVFVFAFGLSFFEQLVIIEAADDVDNTFRQANSDVGMTAEGSIAVHVSLEMAAVATTKRPYMTGRVAAGASALKQVASDVGAACDSHQYRCSDGKCVDVARRCDGHRHCEDDEVREDIHKLS